MSAKRAIASCKFSATIQKYGKSLTSKSQSDLRLVHSVQKLRAFKFKLRTNSRQRQTLLRFAGCKRFVYNKALSLQNAQLQVNARMHSYADLCKLLTQWRHSEGTAFLADAPSHPLQQGLKDLGRAFTNFFARRAKHPRFKKKGANDSFRYPDPKQFKVDNKNGRIFLPKLGWLRYRKSREIAGLVKQVTVSRSGDNWFVAIQTEQEVPIQQSQSNSAVGIDLGVKTFATLSDGTQYIPEISYSRYEQKIAKEHRNLSRKIKFSRRWCKQVRKIQNLYQRVSNSRLDFHHKASHAISKNHAVVVVEDLNVKGMSATASGTVENPGHNVKAKSGLNKAILRQGWSAFITQLKYKVENTGSYLLPVPAHNTSNKCSKCGFISKENRKTQAKFVCTQCNHFENADLNAARNILAAGLAVLASGETPTFSMKLEPTVSAIIRKSFCPVGIPLL